MDTQNYLNKDRKGISTLMQKLVASKTVRERANIFEAIKAELIAEAEAEEDLLYQELNGHQPQYLWVK